MTNLILLPRKFWNDREGRDLPMPKAIGWSKSHVSVLAQDPVLDDYLSDAEYYSNVVMMSGERGYFGLQASARATVKAIKSATA